MTQVTKTFVAADGTDVVANDSSWTYTGSAVAIALNVLSNKLGPGNIWAGAQYVYLNNVSFGLRQNAKITISGPDTSTFSAALLRHTPGDWNNRITCIVSEGTQIYTLTKAGVDVEIATTFASGLVDNEVWEFEISADSTTFSAKRNGAHVGASPWTIDPDDVPTGVRMGCGLAGTEDTESARVVQAVFDDFAPTTATLSAPTAAPGSTSATIGATTDQASGTLYVVVDTAANLAGVTATQIKAGQKASGSAALAANNAAVSTTSPSVGVTGLSATTLYSFAAVQNNANGDSNVVTGTFTTLDPPITQSRYRWRNDDGSETTATWAASENADLTAPRLETRRLRVQVQADGDPASSGYRLQYRRVGDSTWRDLQ